MKRPRRSLDRGLGHTSPLPGQKPRSDVMTDTPPFIAGLKKPQPIPKEGQTCLVSKEKQKKGQWRIKGKKNPPFLKREYPGGTFRENQEESSFPNPLKKLAIPAGLEPATYCLEGSCSIRLSYGTAKPETECYQLSEKRKQSNKFRLTLLRSLRRNILEIIRIIARLDPTFTIRQNRIVPPIRTRILLRLFTAGKFQAHLIERISGLRPAHQRLRTANTIPLKLQNPKRRLRAAGLHHILRRFVNSNIHLDITCQIAPKSTVNISGALTSDKYTAPTVKATPQKPHKATYDKQNHARYHQRCKQS